jgi:hypothetical protein
MRQGQPNQHHNNKNRMRNRNRKGGGPNPLTRSYESNGGDVKIRGTALHVAEKYVQLARDAQASGDRVAGENYLQHAEHYYRIVAAAQAQMPQPQQIYRNDEDGDDEEGDGPNAGGFQGGQQPMMQQNGNGQGGYRDNQNFQNNRPQYQGNNNHQQGYANPDAPQPAPNGNGMAGQGEQPAFEGGNAYAPQERDDNRGQQGGGQQNQGGGGNFRGRRRRPYRDNFNNDRGGERPMSEPQMDAGPVGASESAGGEE